MRTFVTGGSGFLGRRLLRVLRRQGDRVRALARSPTAIAAVTRAGAEPVAGDLLDEALLSRGMEGCDVVIHAAARVSDWGRAEDFHRDNVTGTERVLAAARRAGIEALVHVSTEFVLVGGPPIVQADETWPLPARPLGVYARTKGLAEERVRAANARGFRTVIVRPPIVWGPGDRTWLPRLEASVRRGVFRWIGGGRHPVSTCHVANICEGILRAAERGRGGGAYFLTDGPPVELRWFFSELLRTRGLDPPTGTMPRWFAHSFAWSAETLWRVLPLPGAPPVTRYAVRVVGEEMTVRDDLARRELGYEGRTSVAEGLAELREAAG